MLHVASRARRRLCFLALLPSSVAEDASTNVKAQSFNKNIMCNREHKILLHTRACSTEQNCPSNTVFRTYNCRTLFLYYLLLGWQRGPCLRPVWHGESKQKKRRGIEAIMERRMQTGRKCGRGVPYVDANQQQIPTEEKG